MKRYDAVIIGGGPAGSSAAIGLAQAGKSVALVEKRAFPREVMCGEFLSHEVSNAIRQFGLFEEFLSLHPNKITTFRFIPSNGREQLQPIGFEAWSLKRSLLDRMLLRKAESAGATVLQPAEAVSVQCKTGGYEILCKEQNTQRVLHATFVVAAYGKQNRLDKTLKRDFVSLRSGMTGVKFHLPASAFMEFPDSEIRLFTAEGIYCGVNRVSEDEATLCFLSRRSTSSRHPNEALRFLLRENKPFRDLLREPAASGAFEVPPYGSGNIFFGRRNVVEDGVFMVGDAAAVIAPLAGDGIGMAIESGLLLAGILLEAKRDARVRAETESLYTKEWNRRFRKRLRVASFLQTMAMTSVGARLGARIMGVSPSLGKRIIRGTRSRFSPTPLEKTPEQSEPRG
jgi:flavin-dependent dehydrogenase